MFQVDESKLATHVLAIMIAGIDNGIKECIGFFATTSAKAEFLYQCMWKAVAYLELIGLKVCAVIGSSVIENDYCIASFFYKQAINIIECQKFIKRDA